MAGLEVRGHATSEQLLIFLLLQRSPACFLTQAKGYKFDYDDWHAHVHGQLPYTELLQRDPQLAQALKAIPLPKWVFTNGDIRHAETCLRILGLDRGIFEVGLPAAVAWTSAAAAHLMAPHELAWHRRIFTSSSSSSDCSPLQGIICFESVMKQAQEEGALTAETPICCKPNAKVCACWHSLVAAPVQTGGSLKHLASRASGIVRASTGLTVRQCTGVRDSAQAVRRQS